MLHITNFWKDANNTHKDKQSQCCGCTACASICPVMAISMSYDKEGFLYPRLNEDLCLNCGRCLRVCPVYNECKDNNSYLQTYAGYSTDNEILSKSTSGGFATELSRLIISKGGLVFGVSYDENYVKARYSIAASIEDLLRFAGSKYIQAEKGPIFNEVKQNLLNGKLVLFTGLPCDIAALKLFLNKDYENLYTCELICMGVTSYKIAEDYKLWREKERNTSLVYLNARSKHNGWFVPHLEEHFSDGSKKYSTLFGTYYGRGFQIYNRSSCYECQYRGEVGLADFRIGDFWGIKKDDPYYNENGVSCIFVRTNKGMTLIKELGKVGFFLYQTDYLTATGNNMSSYTNKSLKYIKLKKRFLMEYQRKGLGSACWSTADLGFIIKYLLPLKYTKNLKHLYHLIIDKKK